MVIKLNEKIIKVKTAEIKDIDTKPSIATFHPILEDNILMCVHGGKVNLKAKNAKKNKI